MKKQFFEFLKKCFLTGLFFALIGTQYINAQQTITGTVSDEEGPIPGANILVKGTTTGTQSDFDGNYSIEASPENVLTISYIGYVTQNITVGDQTTINISLQTDQQQLDEVVVIGYGTVKKSDVTGAVSRVDSKSFEAQPLTRVEEALQGRAAGVVVSKANGAPGAGIKVRIRGVNSITGDNSPLVVIDGIQGGDLSTLNPNDIAAMDVLKDASATAIYGVRGSNGVIIVTTKKGSGKGKIDIDYFTSVSTVPEFLPTLADTPADFARIENIRRTILGGNPNFTDAEIADLEANGGTNYQREIFRTAYTKNLQISANGSEGKLRYFISGNYRDQEGIVINTKYQQLSLRTNLDAQISDKFKVSLNVFAYRGQNQNDFSFAGNGQGSLVAKALTWDPTTPIFDENGEYNIRSIKSIASLNDNPVRTLRESDAQDVEKELNTALNATYTFTDNFSYTLNAGTQLQTNNRSVYDVETQGGLPDALFRNNEFTSYQISNILTWQKEFDKHDIKLTGVQEYSNQKIVVNGYNANTISLPRGFFLAELADPAGQSITNDFSERELSSFMLRAEYILDDNLFLTATGRYDGTSVFRQEQRWGFFPSVALAYKLDDLIDSSGANSLKLRAGWGQVGNQNVGPYSTFGGLSFGSYSFDQSSNTPGTILDSFENEELTWETTTQTNVGIDFGFGSGRGNISLDGYKKITSDLLLEVPVPSTFGGGTIFRNVGEVENIGIDVALGYDIIATDNMTWSSNFSLSYVKNEVTQLYDDLVEIQGLYTSPGGQSRVLNTIQLGQPLGQFQGAVFLGTYKLEDNIPLVNGEPIAAPGDPKYKLDENNEIAFETIGNGTPDFFWGFNNTFNYKNFDLNVFFQGTHGFDIYNIQQAMITGGAGDSRSFLASNQVNQWTPQNQTDIPQTVTQYNSSRVIEKGDFIRLSNLNIGYTIKDVWGAEGTSLKIYAGGQNLFLITDYSGYDPELSSRKGGQGTEDVAPGINIGAYPNPRIYTLGLKVRF